MKSTYNDMPMVRCPNCDEQFEWSDYFDIKEGHERNCDECGASLVVLDVDYTINCRIGVKCSPSHEAGEKPCEK